MAEYRSDGRVFRIDPPDIEPAVGTVHDLNGYRFTETLHGPMRWGTCVDCGKPALEVQPTGRVGAGGLEEDAGTTARTRCDNCGRLRHGADLGYYETGRDALYVQVRIDPRRLDPQHDSRGRTSCAQFFAPAQVGASNVRAERDGVRGRWGPCVRCRLPIDPAGRTVEHPDRHMTCTSYVEDASMETPMFPTTFVALASAYPTEADARGAADPGQILGHYRGLWKMPTPEATVVHLFTDVDSDSLRGSGWTEAGPGSDFSPQKIEGDQ